MPLRASLQVYFSPFSSLALQYTRMHTHCHSHCCARTHAHAFSGLQFSPGHAHTRKPVGCYLKAVADVPNLDFYCVFLVLLLLTKYFGWTFNSRRTWRTNARNHVTKKSGTTQVVGLQKYAFHRGNEFFCAGHVTTTSDESTVR